jgi:hypothetical protein
MRLQKQFYNRVLEYNMFTSKFLNGLLNYSLLLLIATTLAIAPIMTQYALAAEVISTFDAKSKVTSSTISGMPLNAQNYVSYIRGGWYVMDIIAGTSSTHADLDKNAAITDNGNIIIMTSTVTSSTISGLAVGDQVKCTFDNTIAVQTCSNLSKGTSSITSMWFFDVRRQTIADEDTTAPTVSITAPANGATISGTISVTASASDNVGVTKVAFYVDGVLKGTDTASPYSYSLGTSTLTNAAHTIKAIAYDAANNQRTHQISVTVSNGGSSTTDTTPPSVTFIDPENGETIAGSLPVQISATDNAGVKVVYFYVDGTYKGSDYSAPYVFNFDATAYAVGSHMLKAKAFDSSNNQNSKEISIAVSNVVSDTTAPTVSITAPANGATISGTISVTASASDNVGVTKVAFYVDGVLKGTDTASPYSYSLGTSTLTNAAHTIKAIAYDAANNQGTRQISVTVSNPIADTTAPTVTLTSPSNGATIKGIVTVTASASDNVGVSKVAFYVDNVLKSTDTSSPFSYSLDTNTLSNAAHTIKAIAYDAANNQANHQISVTVSNTVADTAAPTVSITSPANGATVKGTITISASASDNVGVTKVAFYVDGVLKSTDTTSAYSYSLDTTTLSNAAHTIKAIAYDAANNQRTHQISVTVSNDKTAPVVQAPPNRVVEATSSGGAVVNYPAATATDNIGVTYGPVCTPASGSLFRVGVTTVTCTAKDAAGNTGSATFTVTVKDTTAPTVVIDQPVDGSTVRGIVAVKISATDNTVISKVEVYLDGTLYRTLTILV